MSSSNDQTRVSTRNRPLDGIRGFAASLIVCHHVFFAAGTTNAYKDGIGRFTGRLDVGVPIFFVLSGFLLFKPFVSAIFNRRDLPSIPNFLAKRFIRIFPAYWIALIVLLCIGGVAVNGAVGFFYSFFLIHIYHPFRAITGITQSWSLATEISFYVLLPLFSILLRRVCRGRSVNQSAIIIVSSLAGLYVFSFLFRLTIHIVDPSFAKITPVWLPAQVDIFALGMLIAVLAEWATHNPVIDDFNRVVVRRSGLACVLAALAFVVMSTQFGLAVGLDVASFLPETLRQAVYGLIGLLLVAPFALRDSGSRMHAFAGWSPFAWIGLISYGIYIWHQIVISGRFAETRMPYQLFDGGLVDRFAWTIGSTLLLATTSYYLLEEHLMRLYSRRRAR